MSLGAMTIVTLLAMTLSVAGCVGLVYELVFRRHAEIDRRWQDEFRDEFRDEMRGKAQQSPLFKDLQQLSAGVLVPEPTLLRRLQILVEQSGLAATVTQLTIIAAAIGAATAVGMVWSTGRWWTAPLAVVGSFVGTLLYVKAVRKRRMDLLCTQLPEAFELMARSLRAGCTLQTAFQTVAADFQSPIHDEFAYCYEQQHLGIAFDVALRDLARRNGVMELQIFVVAMIVQRKAGGNLAALLVKLAQIMRNRWRMQAKVKALTGEGRMQAAVLSALAPLALVVMYVLNRQYAEVLLDHRQLLYLAGGSQVFGMLCIRKIVNGQD